MKTKKRVSKPHDYSGCLRKLKRSVIRHQAEKSYGKTIKAFRCLWKESRTKKGHVSVNGGKQIKKKSMLRRAVGKLVGA